MLFNSLHFGFFFVLVTAVFFVLRHQFRWAWLLASSCYFYMAFVPVYILILGFTIGVDYVAGICIEKAYGRRRKAYLVASLVANVGVLAFFKYYPFLVHNVSFLADQFGAANPLPVWSILLPIGLSFHTFQSISYTVEVYRGHQKAERHLGIFALYVMFYPQLVAGPIERPQNLLHQFREKQLFDYDRVVQGLQLMAWGLLKKVVIADRLALLVDAVYDHPYQHSSVDLALATLLFSFQILCDFSGYSDMAIGAARVMGFRLMRNFDNPYQATNIQDFWRRWHISLSSWFKDYLYIPLGGNRVKVPRAYVHLMLVFLISGLWHGAQWTFVCWGFLHGIYLIVALASRPWRARWSRRWGIGAWPVVSTLFTFGCVSFAWIFFRAPNVHTAIFIARKILFGLPQYGLSIGQSLPAESLSFSLFELGSAVGLVVFLESIHYLQSKKDLWAYARTLPVYWRWSLYWAWVLAILFLGVFDNRQFIYFQF